MKDLSLPFEECKILVVGDIMLDRYLWGQVRRISPEAPVPVVKLRRTTEALGGAGNVANNLAGLGCRVTVIGLCGRDETAASLKRLLDEKGIRHELTVDGSRPTITKTRIMAQKQQVLRLDEEHGHGPDEGVLAALKKSALDALSRSDAVILSDYGKGIFHSAALAQDLIQAAGAEGVPVLVDPKGVQWERYAGATCVTPNTAELEACAGQYLENDPALLATEAEAIRRRYTLASMLVTRGEHGMCLIREGEAPEMISARALEVYDVSGAGDTVIATLAACLAVGLPMDRAAAVANHAAGVVVGKLGTQPILKSELLTALQFNDRKRFYPYAAAKMTDLPAALARVQEWRAAGDAVVFTNGCFDLLHPGHISLLYQARSLGARLVVGLNSDDSVRRLKGPQRPILAGQDRAAMLSALACVDLVVQFDEDTPMELIRALKPDVLVKGADYRRDQVVGGDVVESYGGRVELVQLVEGYSTTGITQKMRAENKSRPAE